MHRLSLSNGKRLIPVFALMLGCLPASLGAQSVLSQARNASTQREDTPYHRVGSRELTRRWYGTQRGEQYGSALAVLRDLDGDGAADLAIGAPRAGRRGFGPGRVEVRSGRTGAVLWEQSGNAAGDRFGSVLAAAGDTDGDGIEDLLVGAPGVDNDGADCGQVTLLSGFDGSVLHLWSGSRARPRFGAALTGLGDIDDDGYDDFAIAAPVEGAVHIRSGHSGKLLRKITAPDKDCDFGHELAAGQDFDGDGHPDLIVAAPGFEKDRGALFRVDLRNGRMVRLTKGPQPGVRLGASLAVLSEPGHTPTIVIGTDTADEVDPLFRLRDRRIQQVQEPDGRPTSAQHIASGGDADGDGHSDLLTSTLKGRATLLRGCSGEPMLQEIDHSQRTGLGRVLAVGDLDGDGFAEIALGQPFESGAGPSNGAVLLRDLGHEGAVPIIDRVGRPCSRRPDRLPRIDIHGQPRLGAEISFSLRSAMPQVPATLLIGRPQVRDLTGLGLTDCELRTTGQSLSVPVRTNRQGRASTDTGKVPMDPELLGRALVAQWVYKDGRKPAASDAVVLTFGR